MPIFFFNDTATTEIYTLSLHDALPIFPLAVAARDAQRDRSHGDRLRDDHGPLAAAALPAAVRRLRRRDACRRWVRGDRKSTRLNSSHANISYAVFCLKKKQHVTVATEM